jgi:hypothetical protein
MKKTRLLTTALLALAGIGLAVAPASAASVSYSDGDLFLAFYATSGSGKSTDYLVNLGSASTFTSASGSMTLNIGDIGSDLVDTYGADWNTRSDLYWGVFGTTYTQTVGSDPANTIYMTKPESSIGTIETGFTRTTNGQQGVYAADMHSVGYAYGNFGYTSTVNSNVGVLQSINDQNAFENYQSNQNGNVTSFTIYSNTMGNFGNLTDGTALDLFRMAPGDPNAGLAGDTVGTFTIDDSGTVTFSAVPEPGTCVLIGAAAAFLLVVIRRRKIQNA